MWDDTWVGADAAAQDEILSEIADPDQLGATSVRLTVYWDACEPQEGVFDDHQVGLITQAVDAARAHGLDVILTFYSVPRWASDRTQWRYPPQRRFTKNTYYNFYVPSPTAMTAYEGFIEHMTMLLAGKVFAWECWNEPNIMWFWYPQRTSGNSHYGVDRYIDMLKRFSRIVRENDPGALVLGGNTASLGYDIRNTTSPITWANRLKQEGADRYFDAYSHHPYALGGTGRMDAPEQAPPAGYRKWMVTLGNIGTLLAKFPTTDFYLTEYGYNTKACGLFADGHVSEATQAAYIRRAYKWCARFPQIQLLTWYLRRDVKRTDDGLDQSMYSGLRRLSGSKKPGWYAYAGNNRLSIASPSSVRHKAIATLTGMLAHAGAGLMNRPIVLQRRTGGRWVDVKSVHTRADGSYKVGLRLRASARLRVVWRGVIESSQRTVRVR